MTFQRLRVLVVDDDQSTQHFLRDLLCFWNCGEVEIASNGEEGVQKYRQFRPDLVLMDLDMPLKNGLDASCDIMKLDSHATILLITCAPNNTQAQQALEKGFVKVVIPKSFHFNQLEMAIQEVLEKPKSPLTRYSEEGTLA